MGNITTVFSLQSRKNHKGWSKITQSGSLSRVPQPPTRAVKKKKKISLKKKISMLKMFSLESQNCFFILT